MFDDGDDLQQQETEAQPAAARRPSMFDDPVVRRMAFAAVAILVLFLATVVGVLASGVTAPSGPRTAAEKELAVARAAVEAGSTDTEEWGQYIAVLIDSGQYSSARSLIERGRASLEDSATAEFALAESRLLLAQRNYEEAIATADQAQEQIQAAWDEVVARGDGRSQQALFEGLHPNYYAATLVKARAYESLGDWESVIAQYDIYIEGNPTAADILIDRGNARVEVGDVAGAEADFRESLRFIPDNPEALEALERIGVSE